MKKILCIVMVMVLSMSLMACGKNKDNNQGSTENTTEQDQPADEGNAGNEGGTGNEESAAGENNSSETVDVSMEDLKAAVVQVLGDDYWPNTDIDEEMLASAYGITSDMYDDYFGQIPMISTNVDTLIIVKAKEDKIEEVETALNEYRDLNVENGFQYPMNVGKVQASRIETLGNYVCFVQLGADTVNASEQGDEAVIAQCLEANEKAIDAIERTLRGESVR